jgi:hypothetical protein
MLWLERCFAEIRLRAIRKIGELSRELEKNIPGGADAGSTLPPMGKSKGDMLADAGISTSSAYRYEQLAGPREEQARASRQLLLGTRKRFFRFVFVSLTDNLSGIH